jgi:hypothetical protein
MHQDVVKELRQLQAQRFSVRDRVFKSIPRMSVFKADLLAAKIDLVDALGTNELTFMRFAIRSRLTSHWPAQPREWKSCDTVTCV